MNRRLAKPNLVELTVDRLLQNPDFFLLAIDSQNRTAIFIELTQPEYRSLSFLDDRALAAERRTYLVDLDQLLDVCRDAYPDPEKAPQFLFHTGHCCSTLLARCMEMIDGCFVLKEPFVLHQLASYRIAVEKGDFSKDELDQLLNLTDFFLSRTYNSSSRVLIKADCNFLMDTLCRNHPRVGWLFPTTSHFILAVLKVSARRQWARDRLRDSMLIHLAMSDDYGLASAFRAREHRLTDSEAAGFWWLSQMCLFHRTVEFCGNLKYEMIATQDFLDHPFDILRRVLMFFGFEVDQTDIRTIVDSSVMQYHSKGTSRRFDIASRNSQFQYLSQKYQQELRTGLDCMNEVLNRLTLPQILYKHIYGSIGLSLLSA